MGGRHQQADHRAGRLHQDVLRQTHAAQHPDPLLRVRRRPQAAGDAAVPDRGDRTDPADASRSSTNTSSWARIERRRLHLAHHRLRQDADQLQGGATGAQAGRTSTRCCSWWTARIWTTRPCASTSASRRARPTPTPRRRCCKRQLEDPDARDHHHHHPEAEPLHRREQGASDL